MINKIRKDLKPESTDILVNRKQTTIFSLFSDESFSIGAKLRLHNEPPIETYRIFGRSVHFIDNLNIDFIVLPATFHKL